MKPKDRVTLSPITMADAPVLFKWINDRKLVLFNSAYRPVHERTHREWLQGLAARQDLVAFAVRTVPGRRLIGTCQLTSISATHRSADLQIRMGDERTRGQGLGLAAVRQLVEFGFRDLNLNRIALQVFATNGRAIKTYERAGFTIEGLLREAAFVDGQFIDVVVMSILAGEFAP